MRLTWHRQVPPLSPSAVAAVGPAAVDLAERASGRTGLAVDRIGEWTFVRGDDLPWVDGAVYLGALPNAAHLVVPVHCRPSAPPAVVAAALRLHLGPGSVALLPSSLFGTPGEGALVALPW